MKDTVLLEYIGDNKVSVIPYDLEEAIFGEPLEVTTREDATEKYDIVGELFEGEVILNNSNSNDDYNEDYSNIDDNDEEE